MSSNTGRNRCAAPTFRGTATFLILASLFFNILSTVAAARSWSSVHETLDELQSSDRIVYVLCTPNGVKKIAFDENGNPVEEDSSGTDNLCLFCLPFHKIDAALLTSAELVQLLIVSRDHTPVALQDQLLLPYPYSKKASPRAPPLFS
ncbi:DUF2946 family protein [Emcibacter sp.]|uniref:DUF2946 family protein n=1 Tax=Emcibacter sp. TaxID=1979954 RepID=UPI002AA67256|nr:DUF2946 family protein [Emcibacter sp.]